MAEQHLQSKLIVLLKEEKIQLWNPPFTNEHSEADLERMRELAIRLSGVINFPLLEVEIALEEIRSQAVKKGKGNKTFRETQVATLDLILPRLKNEEIKTSKKKQQLQTRLDISAMELVNLIGEKYELKYFKLILNGKELSPEKRLNEQNVKNNSRIMVLKVSEPEGRKEMEKVEEKQRQKNEGLQRTQKGFEILSERDGSEDPATTPFLEIADQKGNTIQIPPSKKKALILAMGFHEKGRALMKRKDYDSALCHLILADEQFSKCDSALLNTVDNYAVLQLDIVWCYRALEALSCLDDAKQRLQRAEDCFLKCYGQDQWRLQQIKGTTGGEDVLFLRLYLLQSVLAYHDGNSSLAAQKLQQVESLYSGLCLNPESMMLLMSMGFSEQETRLGLRACRGNVEDAAVLIAHRKNEREEIEQREREKMRQCLESINVLVELGFSKSAASEALHQSKGDVDEAYRRLLDSSQSSISGASQPDTDRQSKVEQMTYLGFERDAVERALMLAGDDVSRATEILLDNQGVIPSDILPPSPPSSSSEEPSTSESTASASSSTEADLVNEILDDIPRHEEDYLDVTMEEESEVIALMKSYLEKSTKP